MDHNDDVSVTRVQAWRHKMVRAIGTLPQALHPVCYYLLGIANSMNCPLKGVF